MSSSEAIRTAVDALGVIHRHVTVRLVNISGSGCLLESCAPLEPGTIGTLRMVIDGADFSDLVRVARCREIVGSGGLHHVGVQFLWEDTPGPRALRRLGTKGFASSPHNGTRLEFTLPGMN
jgi:hypothetical protein